MDEAEEVFDVVFPPGNEAAEVVHPCEEPFHASRVFDSGGAGGRPEFCVSELVDSARSVRFHALRRV